MRFLTTTATRESTHFYARFGFDVPVRDLQWGTLDCDTNGGSPGWEDGVRIWGTDGADASGNRIPYQLDFAASPSFQRAGDFVEGDTGNVVDANTNGNSTATFRGTVRSVSTEASGARRAGHAGVAAHRHHGRDAVRLRLRRRARGVPHVAFQRRAEARARHAQLVDGRQPPDGEAEGQPEHRRVG